MTISYDQPLPPGAVGADFWQDDAQPYRVVFGVSRGIEGRDDVLVGTTAVQLRDGTVDDGRVEPPHVYVETNSDSGLTSAQARELSAVLLEAAAEADRWSNGT